MTVIKKHENGSLGFFSISCSATACLNRVTEVQHHTFNARQPEIYLRARCFSPVVVKIDNSHVNDVTPHYNFPKQLRAHCL